MSRVISIKGLNVVSGCQGHHCQESSLSRAWTLCLEVSQVCLTKNFFFYKKNFSGLMIVSGCQESSLSRAWTWCLDVRVITAKSLNVVSGGQSSLFNKKKCFTKKKFQASWLCLDVKSHLYQGPERGVRMSGSSLSRAWMLESSLSRAWTWCLDVRVITVKGLNDVSRCQVISVKGLNIVSGCQGHHCQEPERCD